MEFNYTGLQTKLAHFGNALRSPLLLLIRLFWGWGFLITGIGKFIHMQDVIHYFHSLGIPFAPASVFITASFEIIGGCLLILGLASRAICIPLIFITIIAFATADIDAVRMFFSNPQNFIHRDPFSFLLASLLIFVFGPGSISLDWLIERNKGNF